jgi:hypothetical protein
MFHHSWPMSQDLWLLYHKVTFDGVNSLIIVNDGELAIDVKVDLYSDWKEWAYQRDHLKFLPAMRAVGGDPTVGGNFLGSTFFTINNWRVLISDATTFDGNLFSDDFNSPYTTAPGTTIASTQFSNLVDTVAPDSADLITAGVATTGNIIDQTTDLTNTINTQTTTLQNDISGISTDLVAISGALPADVVTQLNDTNYDGVPFGDIMSIMLAMAQGRIVENGTGVFEFYAQDNSTILYTLTKSGNQRTRS